MDDSGLLPETDEKHQFETRRLAGSEWIWWVWTPAGDPRVEQHLHGFTWPHPFILYIKQLIY